jgi:hypothetical protein
MPSCSAPGTLVVASMHARSSPSTASAGSSLARFAAAPSSRRAARRSASGSALSWTARSAAGLARLSLHAAAAAISESPAAPPSTSRDSASSARTAMCGSWAHSSRRSSVAAQRSTCALTAASCGPAAANPWAASSSAAAKAYACGRMAPRSSCRSAARGCISASAIDARREPAALANSVKRANTAIRDERDARTALEQLYPELYTTLLHMRDVARWVFWGSVFLDLKPTMTKAILRKDSAQLSRSPACGGK